MKELLLGREEICIFVSKYVIDGNMVCWIIMGLNLL